MNLAVICTIRRITVVYIYTILIINLVVEIRRLSVIYFMLRLIFFNCHSSKKMEVKNNKLYIRYAINQFFFKKASRLFVCKKKSALMLFFVF